MEMVLTNDHLLPAVQSRAVVNEYNQLPLSTTHALHNRDTSLYGKMNSLSHTPRASSVPSRSSLSVSLQGGTLMNDPFPESTMHSIHDKNASIYGLRGLKGSLYELPYERVPVTEIDSGLPNTTYRDHYIDPKSYTTNPPLVIETYSNNFPINS